jgi:circadian clock protein KaiC
MGKNGLLRVSTGIPGLDEILDGGLLGQRSYLVRGRTGTGKSTFGLHFLLAGAERGEKVLYITVEEPLHTIRQNAEARGFDLSGIDFLDLSPTSEFFAQASAYDIFSPAEVEREPTTKRIVAAIGKLRPRRVFLDAVTLFRYLSTDAFSFRKQVLSFVRFLVDEGATLVFSSEASTAAPDDDLQFISDGVIELYFERSGRVTRRAIAITKLRGSDFRPGIHTMKLTDRGIEVFPRLLPEAYAKPFRAEPISSGVPQLDELLHGGIERGTVTIVAGPSGVGKTSTAMQFMKEAAGRGERSVVFTFEESRDSILKRSEAINIPVHDMVERGTLAIIEIEPLRFTADEFDRMVRHEVEAGGATIAMIDSIKGYELSISGEDLIGRLHALARYFRNMGVTALLTNEIEAVTGEFRVTEHGISYLTDNIIFLRYLEINGQMRKAIGVLKKRLSDFERTLREVSITRYGIQVGEPLTGLRGILRGTPEWTTPPRSLEEHRGRLEEAA